MAQAQEKKGHKEAMKQLRAERKEKIAAASARMKEQKKAIKAITEVLKYGGKTVPQIAEQTGMGASEVLWYIAALKKYGQIVEGKQDGSYFQYELAQQPPAEERSEAEEE